MFTSLDGKVLFPDLATCSSQATICAIASRNANKADVLFLVFDDKIINAIAQLWGWSVTDRVAQSKELKLTARQGRKW